MSVRTELARRRSACAERMFLQNSPSAENDTAVRDAEQVNRTRNNSRDLLELLVSYALILSANWTSNPIRQWLYCAAVVWIGGSTTASFTRSKSIEFRMTGFWNSLW